ncbi:MAG TPA: hypothetical protein VMF88_13660 [Bacteroidota bacterium]|nr:hypothetical protein [Bacteroidota bacterium]
MNAVWEKAAPYNGVVGCWLTEDGSYHHDGAMAWSLSGGMPATFASHRMNEENVLETESGLILFNRGIAGQ